MSKSSTPSSKSRSSSSTPRFSPRGVSNFDDVSFTPELEPIPIFKNEYNDFWKNKKASNQTIYDFKSWIQKKIGSKIYLVKGKSYTNNNKLFVLNLDPDDIFKDNQLYDYNSYKESFKTPTITKDDFIMIDDLSFDASGKDALFYIYKDKYAPQLFNKIKEIQLSTFQDMRQKNIVKHIKTTAKNMTLSQNTTRTNTPSPLLPPEWQSAQPSRTSSSLSIINPMTIPSSSNHTSSDNLLSYNQSPNSIQFTNVNLYDPDSSNIENPVAINRTSSENSDIDEEDGDDSNIPQKRGIGGRYTRTRTNAKKLSKKKKFKKTKKNKKRKTINMLNKMKNKKSRKR